MNGTWSFVDAITGVFTGRTFSGPERSLADNTPEGMRAVEGLLERRDDPDRQRARTLAHIAEIERQQLRPMRELQIDSNNTAARQRLESIDAQIAQLRNDLGG